MLLHILGSLVGVIVFAYLSAAPVYYASENRVSGLVTTLCIIACYVFACAMFYSLMILGESLAPILGYLL